MGHFGMPRKCITDHGSTMMSKKFQVFLRHHGIKHQPWLTISKPMDGLVEQVIQTLKTMLWQWQSDKANGTDWHRHLRECTFAYNMAGMSPWKKPLSFSCMDFIPRAKRVAQRSNDIGPWSGHPTIPGVELTQVWQCTLQSLKWNQHQVKYDATHSDLCYTEGDSVMQIFFSVLKENLQNSILHMKVHSLLIEFLGGIAIVHQ